MRAVVHIGAPKAGSSAIQDAIRANRAALAGQGIYAYHPRRGPVARALSTRYERSPVLPPQVRRQLGETTEARDWSEACWQDLAETVRTERPAVTLLSSEHFFNLPRVGAFMRDLREIFDEIDVILYIRDPVDQFCSVLGQQIRDGRRLEALWTPNDFVYYGYSDPRGFLDAVGQDRMTVRNFDRTNLSGGDVVSDFFEVLGRCVGRPVEAPAARPARSNEALCGAATAWLLTANETFRNGNPKDKVLLDRRAALIRRLRHDPALAGLPRLSLDDPELAQQVRARAHEACEWYNATFMDGQVPLQTARPPERPADPEETRGWLRDWLLGYLTPEALPAVLRAAAPLSETPPPSTTGRRG